MFHLHYNCYIYISSMFTESGDSIGKQMHELKLTKQPVNVLRKKILHFSHPNPHVMRLVTFLTNMVAFNPDDRVDVMETMDVVADVRDKCKLYFGYLRPVFEE